MILIDLRILFSFVRLGAFYTFTHMLGYDSENFAINLYGH